MDMIHNLEQEIKNLYKELVQVRDEFDKFKQKLILHTIEVKMKRALDVVQWTYGLSYYVNGLTPIHPDLT